MAVLALTNEYLLFNAVDLSDHVTQAIVTANAEDLDATAMSSGGWKTHLGGLKAGQLQIDFLDDFALSSVDATIWNAFITGTAIAFEVKAVNAARSTTNPSYTGNIIPLQFAVGGQVGTVAKKSLTLPITGALARQTS